MPALVIAEESPTGRRERTYILSSASSSAAALHKDVSENEMKKAKEARGQLDRVDVVVRISHFLSWFRPLRVPF